MIFSKIAVSLLCTLLLLSIFVAHLLNIIATDNFDGKNKVEGENYTKYLGKKYGKITDSPKNLMWFLQISDLHISIFRDPGRISHFQQFCDNTVKRIKPSIVLASGDLTDAKTKDNLGSSQEKTEWIYYYNIIKESGVTADVIWLDIRGNHDNFNVMGLNSQQNYFLNFSIQGVHHPKSYVHIENRNGVNVAFLGIDACPDPGLRRPFNFIGILDVQEQQYIQKLQAEAVKNADHIVWFAHYPTSCILAIEEDTPRLNLRQLIGDNHASQVYVCGHLHSMSGLVPHMYTKQKYGYLELELGDWKDNRMFRVAAIDHGLFSFVDQKHNTWPIILVTNPKHARFIMSGREPLYQINTSTHIRILVFSDVDIDEVKISFDKTNWKTCNNKEAPLYVCKWDPHLYETGVHKFHVMAKDVADKVANIEHPFTLDETALNFDITPRIFLMMDAGYVFQGLFATLLIINVLPLVMFRLQRRAPKYRQRFGRTMLRQLWLLSKVNKLFYSIVLYAIYLPLGPWIVGELIDGYIGAVFAWGILIKGTFLPEPFTYMYGSLQLMFIQIPLILILAQCLDKRLFGSNLKGYKNFLSNLPFIFLLSIQMLLAYYFWLEYGTLALLFGPLRSWSIALSIILWYKTLTLPSDYCKKLLKLIESPS